MPRFIFILITFAYIVISTGIAFAEGNAMDGGTVQGFVFDMTQEQNPIEGVTINIVGTDDKVFTVKTNAKGEYKCDNLAAGRYLMNIHKRGYYERTGRAVTIVNGGDHSVQLKMSKLDDAEKRLTEGILQHIVESIGERYNLDARIVEAFHQSILEALNTVLEQMNRNVYALIKTEDDGGTGLIMGLLLHPDCRAAFEKHLTETQLHDYIDFIKARQRQGRQAAAQLITAFLDQSLWLTHKQRENVITLLRDTISDDTVAYLIDVFRQPSLQMKVVDLLQGQLNISLDTVLTPIQAEIWEGVVIFEKSETFPDTLQNEFKSQRWHLAEKIMAVHTEQLGPLNEIAAKRLELVTKGVLQQYIEERKPDDSEKFWYRLDLYRLWMEVIKQNIPHEQATKQLEVMKKTLADESGTNKLWGGTELCNITNHPLYQQTIKDVLSDEAYSQYIARQTERQIFRLQAARDMLVVYIDMLLLLKETHRKQLETTAAQVALPSLSLEGLQIMIAELLLRIGPETLVPWYQNPPEQGESTNPVAQ